MFKQQLQENLQKQVNHKDKVIKYLAGAISEKDNMIQVQKRFQLFLGDRFNLLFFLYENCFTFAFVLDKIQPVYS